MAASKASTKSSSIAQILHLVFTILSIAVLSYKVYFLESELSFIRHELSTRDSNNVMTEMIPASTAATVDKQSRDRRSDGNGRLSQKTSKTTATKQNINADCLQKALNYFQVGEQLSYFKSSFLYRPYNIRKISDFMFPWKGIDLHITRVNFLKV